MLVGKVTEQNGLLNIQAELIDVADGSQLWGQRYSNKALRDVLGVQEEIARDAIGKLPVNLNEGEWQRLRKRYTTSPEAYQAFVKSQYFFWRLSPEGIRKSLEYSQLAIELDPTYALPYGQIAACYSVQGALGLILPKEAREKSKEWARKALKIDDTVWSARSELMPNMEYDWDWAGIEKMGKFYPHYPRYLMAMGRLDEARADLQQRLEREPTQPFTNSLMGQTLYYMRRHDAAIEQYKKTIELDPNHLPARWGLGWTYEQQGRFTEAIAEFQSATALWGNVPHARIALGHAYAVAGQREEAIKILDELIELRKREFIPALGIAKIYIGLNDKEHAFV